MKKVKIISLATVATLVFGLLLFFSIQKNDLNQLSFVPLVAYGDAEVEESCNCSGGKGSSSCTCTETAWGFEDSCSVSCNLGYWACCSKGNGQLFCTCEK